MKQTEITIGGTYLVKVAGNLVPVKIAREHNHGGWEGTSVKTGKTIRIKSPQRLRKRLAEMAPEAMKNPEPSNDADIATEHDTGEAAATVTPPAGKPLSLINAAAIVLQACERPLSTKDIIEKAIDAGIWQPKAGKTPANTLHAAITREIKTKSDASRFRKSTVRGQFELAHNELATR